MSNKLKNAALYYASLGYPVFPCWPGKKNPLTPNGLKAATTDPDIIANWWACNPTANIGLLTEGLVVIDIDVVLGKQNQWLQSPADEKRLNELIDAPGQKTPRGGTHRLFRQPNGRVYRNTTSVIAKNVDTRATGGYIIAAPSLINGIEYEMFESLDVGPDCLPDLPKWLQDCLSKRPPVTKNVNDDIPDGQRNDTLFKLASSLRGSGFGKQAITAAIAAENINRCYPPLEHKEIEKIVKSVVDNYEPNESILPIFYKDEEKSAYIIKDPGPVPEELMTIPGIVDDVIQFCLDTAPRPNRAMAFCGALSLVATLAGRKFRDSSQCRTNFYILGLADSGDGKDWPRTVNSTILGLIGMESNVKDQFATGQGLEDSLISSPNILYQTDEMDSMLQRIKNLKEGQDDAIVATLLRMFSSAHKSYNTRQKAGRELSPVIEQPCLNIFGTAVPENYYESLTEKMMINGFVSRMITIDCKKRGLGKKAGELKPPERLLAPCKYLAKLDYGHNGNLNEQTPQPRIIEETKEATDLFNGCLAAADRLRDIAAEKRDLSTMSVWNRVHEQARKLAIVYAISRNHENPMIDARAAEWSTRFCYHQAKRMLYLASLHVSSSQFHADCLKLLSALSGQKYQAMKKSDIARKMKTDSASLARLLEAMIEQEKIGVCMVQTGRQKTKGYYVL